MANVMQWLT